MKQLIARIDDNLHARLKARAAAEGRTLNALVAEALEAAAASDPRAGASASPGRRRARRAAPARRHRAPGAGTGSDSGSGYGRLQCVGRQPRLPVTVLYADTSAVIRAYFVDEPEHPTLHELLLQGHEAVVTSEITRLELASAAAAARAGRIGEAAAVLAAFDADCGAGGPISLLRLQPEDVLPRAVDLVQQQRLRTLDAIRVAVALSVPHLLVEDDVTFVTRDQQQEAAATALGLRVL